MILVAPDKFKGTLTARRAADIIAGALSGHDTLKAPMADGGEGTAEILCGGPEWDRHDCYYVDPRTRTAVIDSSAVIGLGLTSPGKRDILRATSAPLGVKVREILNGGCRKVVIGIGGTATCDGGEGFLLALDKYRSRRDCIIGLSDVRVPLVAPPGEPSALMFAPQKGATEADIRVLRQRLEALYRKYKCRSPFDGAGGGLGFAIASVMGAECYSGAEYVLGHYNIDWSRISLVITGEGSIDEQTSRGKVVGTLTAFARLHGIPVVAFGGRVDPALESPSVISTSRYMPELPLNEQTAALRLQAAVEDFASSLR